jgi:hypothetical protein
MRVERGSSNNPFAVPLVTLIAYFPSGDPGFPFGGRVEWFDEDGQREECANAPSEFCQIAMGESGVATGQPAMPRSRTITVRYTPPSDSDGSE